MNTDSTIMLRRNFKHILRNPFTIVNGALMPVFIMLMFVYVLGNAFNVGEHYVEYATPGLILLAITYGLSGTAVSVNSDMTKGIINRFKVMNVSRGAVLNGHVVATMLGSSIAVAVIIGMAFALGFRSPATSLEWLGAIGIIAATAFNPFTPNSPRRRLLMNSKMRSPPIPGSMSRSFARPTTMPNNLLFCRH